MIYNSCGRVAHFRGGGANKLGSGFVTFLLKSKVSLNLNLNFSVPTSYIFVFCYLKTVVLKLRTG